MCRDCRLLPDTSAKPLLPLLPNQPCDKERPIEVTAKKTVYLVRHGKARHNIVEEEVKARASDEARALGYSEGDEAYAAHVIQARLEALSDESLWDAELCDTGVEQAEAVREEFGRSNLPKPTVVFVSPLLRTLQTAAALFPEHPRVQVCDVLRERDTGLPCDAVNPARRTTEQFPTFDFGVSVDAREEEDDDSASSESSHSQLPSGSSCGTCLEKEEVEVERWPRARRDSSTADCLVEDAATLRRRTAAFMQVLATVEDAVVCVITHKAWLREFERGPLDRPDAAEFKPCEVRVFDVTVYSNGLLESQPRDLDFEAR